MNKTNLGWKSLLTASLISTFSFAAEPSKPVKAVVTHVIDGDTVAIEAKWIPLPMKPVISVRVYGVDTPEKSYRAKCEAVYQHVYDHYGGGGKDVYEMLE